MVSSILNKRIAKEIEFVYHGKGSTRMSYGCENQEQLVSDIVVYGDMVNDNRDTVTVLYEK